METDDLAGRRRKELALVFREARMRTRWEALGRL